MSIRIEQNKEQARLAFELQRQADLSSIRLVKNTAVCNVAIEDAAFPLRFLLKYKAEDAAVLNSALMIPIRFAFTAVTETDNREVLSIICRLEAVYDLAEGFGPTPQQIEAFKNGNAIFNCWTYFREFVHNTVTRMNYPPPTLPFLRMVPKAAAKNLTTSPKAIEEASLIEQVSQEPERGVTSKTKKTGNKKIS
jgi:hypothetical protein